MVALQHLYSDFLPPHLWLNEEAQKKRQKVNNRPAVYTGESQTSRWWRGVLWGKAAKGCRKLDASGFVTVQKKVCTSKDAQRQAFHRQ